LSEYRRLAYPGGVDVAKQRIHEGSQQAIEQALEFLEARPYFFRSQYIRTKLIRSLKSAPLDSAQSRRFTVVVQRERELKGATKSPPNQPTDLTPTSVTPAAEPPPRQP
jgi:hypothetical protein